MAATAPNLTISGVGAVSDPIFINTSVRATNGLVPGVFVSLSAGATLSYVVEMTADSNDASGNPTPGNWAEFSDIHIASTTNPSNTVSKSAGLKYMARAIRLRLDSWTNGTATIAVVQA